MAGGSAATGLAGSVGIAAETTYGTWVDPTRWIEVRSGKMQNVPHVVQGEGLAGGRALGLGSRRSLVWSDAKGSMNLEFLNTGMALLLVNAMGSNATLSQIGTTTAYSLTADLGFPDGQNFLSMQALVADNTGALKAQNFHGCKFTSAEWSIDLANDLMLALDVDSQEWDDTQTAGTPSYSSSSRNFTLNGFTLSAGSYGSESSVDGVTKATLKLERPLDVERVYAGSSGKKEEPLTNNYMKISGTIDIDLLSTNKATLWDLMNTQSAVPSLVYDFVGNEIGTSGHNDELKLNATDVFIDSGGTPELDGPEQTKTTLNWTGLIDSSNHSALIATLTTADSGF